MGATQGCLITLEGGEGSGKTTQCRLLDQWLTAAGLRVTCTREPGGTALGERLRALLLDPGLGAVSAGAEMLLFSAARAETVAEIIRPALARNEVVLCDRFVDSSLAYQGYGLGLELNFIREVNARVTDGLTVDLTVILDVPPEMGYARRRTQQDDRIEGRGRDYHRRVRDGYRQLAAQDPARIRCLDGTAPIDAVQRNLRDLVAMALVRRGLTAPEREGAAP